jgi:hypothetical protein
MRPRGRLGHAEDRNQNDKVSVPGETSEPVLERIESPVYLPERHDGPDQSVLNPRQLLRLSLT